MTNPWILTSPAPTDNLLYLANGYMSTSLTWSGGVLYESEASPCYVRGVYNDSGSGGIDRLVVVPRWSQVRYGAPGVLKEYQRELDLRHGCVRTSLVIEEQRGRIHIEQTVFVSRADQHLGIVHTIVQPEFDGDVTFVAGLESPLTEDVETLDLGADDTHAWLSSRTRAHRIDVGATLSFHAEDWNSETSTGQNIVTHRFHRHFRAGESQTLTQFARLVTSLESENPFEDARAVSSPYSEIVARHEAEWARLWETDIIIDGDPEVQQFVRAGLFYLWSTVREGDEWSIAPMGLSSNGYNGHIFWDAELWMYPSLLVTHPDMARACVAYRERTLEPARARAAAGGFTGAQFPWEGAFTGEEMTPFWAETRDFQLHITADVAIAQWWYFLNTGDLVWLRNHGFPIMQQCAEFWISRLEYNGTQDRYEISDVVCADEYAAHVNNDAFTNAAVQLALCLTARAAHLLEIEASPEWEAMAAKVYMPYDAEHGRHLEFDGFDGQLTKQADVELLAYPLEHTTDPEQIARDLDYYATIIDPDGPAMSFSVYSIVSAQLGRANDAYSYFQRSYQPNTRPPFQAFSETPTNDEYFFCTGVGGALQAVLYGFSGLRLREESFVLGPCLPDHWTRLELRNLFIQGARTDLVLEPGRLTVRRSLGDRRISVVMQQSDDAVDVSVQWESQDNEPLTIQVSGPGGDAGQGEAPISIPLSNVRSGLTTISITAHEVSNTCAIHLRQPPHGGGVFD